jgi:hypothetical protein
MSQENPEAHQNTTSNPSNAIASPADKISIRVVVEKYSYRAENSLVSTAHELGVAGKSYSSEDYELKISWRQIEIVDEYHQGLEEGFYDHMHNSGLEIQSGNEYGDWYDFEVVVENDKGETIYKGLRRG